MFWFGFCSFVCLGEWQWWCGGGGGGGGFVFFWGGGVSFGFIISLFVYLFVCLFSWGFSFVFVFFVVVFFFCGYCCCWDLLTCFNEHYGRQGVEARCRTTADSGRASIHRHENISQLSRRQQKNHVKQSCVGLMDSTDTVVHCMSIVFN